MGLLNGPTNIASGEVNVFAWSMNDAGENEAGWYHVIVNSEGVKAEGPGAVRHIEQTKEALRALADRHGGTDGH